MATNDPIDRMFERGQLRRETDQDGKAAKARLRAARMWQSIYADLAGAQLNPDNRKAAQAMSELQDHLGEYRSLLLRRVLGGDRGRACHCLPGHCRRLLGHYRRNAARRAAPRKTLPNHTSPIRPALPTSCRNHPSYSLPIRHATT